MRRPITWRQSARPIIAQVLLETKGKPERVIRAALRDAYPFGERACYPYKAWLSEIAVQTKKKRLGGHYQPPDPQQMSLF